MARISRLDHLSLDVPSGEALCLLGLSGCGKTTLLRIAAGVERQTLGHMLLDGQEVARALRSAGLMFQDLAFPPASEILQNFGLRSLTRSEANAETQRP